MFTHHLNKFVANGFLIPPKREESIFNLRQKIILIE